MCVCLCSSWFEVGEALLENNHVTNFHASVYCSISLYCDRAANAKQTFPAAAASH